ncbi:hypothetical protein SAMN05661008_00889 [Alkalithermobacter thermoalcaliphilus JW-YL-7 = DSM 7308]|uniref:Uncharacterized protein n=1 Tax=Alkalithermobacter thermoalcaliphilus JW-YL-7 = DSM 7308 TaxID=1121328 RepID=A0A150FQL1_CLOPD|nr:hypothetical protein JWYL7_0964 [[Clostridium] paradoxum JW-YL-7 = DSM 7308]SHK78572.1 hypothetical protein SAMN05661008_00889 [[Clostridium] paradoxum JW-YL-7 = DSM 7308]
MANKNNQNNQYNKNGRKTPNKKLEFAEELSLKPSEHPSQTGSVSQNTSRPISKRKKNKKE